MQNIKLWLTAFLMVLAVRGQEAEAGLYALQCGTVEWSATTFPFNTHQTDSQEQCAKYCVQDPDCSYFRMMYDPDGFDCQFVLVDEGAASGGGGGGQRVQLSNCSSASEENMIYAQASEIEEWKAREPVHDETTTELAECLDAPPDLEARILELEAEISELQNSESARIPELEAQVSELETTVDSLKLEARSLEAFGMDWWNPIYLVGNDWGALGTAIMQRDASVCMTTENYWILGLQGQVLVDVIAVISAIIIVIVLIGAIVAI